MARLRPEGEMKGEIEEPLRIRFMRPCKKCGEMFRPNSKHNMVCDDCALSCGNWRSRRRKNE